MLKNNKSIEISIPVQTVPNPKKQLQEKIKKLKLLIKAQYDEISKYQDIEISEENKNDIDKLLCATEDLISNCIKDESYLGNKDNNYTSLMFVYQKMSLKLESYCVESKIKELDKRSEEIEKKIEKNEENNNNLVYNLLSFLTAFSIVSAVVGVVTRINGIINIMIFMAFTILILLTTLIALHNFYKNSSMKKSKLQDNYFLWKFLVAILAGLVIILIIKFCYNHKKEIVNFIDYKIENRIDKILEEKMEK